MSDYSAEIDNALELLTSQPTWSYECTAYGEGQMCCCEKGHANQLKLKAALQSLIAQAEKKAIIRFTIDQQPEIEKLIAKAEAAGRIDELITEHDYYGNGSMTMYKIERIKELKAQGDDRG